MKPAYNHSEGLTMLKPPKVLVIGDTHGSVHYARGLIAEAAARGVTRILQLGDWGYLWPSTKLDDRTEELNVVADCLIDNNVTMYFIRGNHDWQEGIFKHEDLLRDLNMMYMHDGWGSIGINCPTFFYGGAVSIDRKRRKEGVDYFKDELPGLVMGTVFSKGRPSILFSHDSPALPPSFRGEPHWLMVGDEPLIADVEESRRRVSQVADAISAKAVFHGHYHTSATYELPSTFPALGLTVTALNQVGSIGECVYLDEDGSVVP